MSKKIKNYSSNIRKASDVFGSALTLNDGNVESVYVQLDAAKKPKNIMFNVKAFWELMCQIDETLADKLSDKDYQRNPAGRIVDAIEGSWDFTPEKVSKLKLDFKKILSEVAQPQLA